MNMTKEVIYEAAALGQRTSCGQLTNADIIECINGILGLEIPLDPDNLYYRLAVTAYDWAWKEDYSMGVHCATVSAQAYGLLPT